MRLKAVNQLCVSCAAKARARYDRPITYDGTGTPKINDTTSAGLLGLVGDQIMFYDPCVKCGKPHWVRRGGKGTYCTRCAPKYHGPRRDRTPDGRYQEKSGYVIVRLEKDDPLWAMTKDSGWVLEHRLVVARRLGRVLAKNEVVHHINGVRCDNRDENLELMTKATHHSHLVPYDYQNRIRLLEQRVTFLEAENVLMREQLASIANPEPSREDNLLGVCRDLTGDTLHEQS